ncbi:MAG: flagellar basal body L-ring protein FlgH [Desulfobacteraceae bacterium]|nr:MAG: flagellar basal body L-ring protein FlgH [Desulfobacteraceae bacterium]
MNYKTIKSIMKSALFVSLLIPYGCSALMGDNGPRVIPAPEGQDRLNQFYASIPPSEGSLWTDSGEMLFMDQRARRIGDTVIVDIVENSSSKMDANTSTTGESTLGYEIDGLTGAANINKNLGSGQLFKAGMTNEWKGTGASDRSGQLTASVGSIVTQVLPNGNIVVNGKREMTVDNETQTIKVSGIIRPQDIGQDNRVKSTFLAEAKIEYIGNGVLADKQAPGWGTRILDKVWPF